MKPCYKTQTGADFFASAKADPGKIPFTFTYGETRYLGFSHPDLTLAERTCTEKDGREDVNLTYSLLGELTVKVLLTHYHTHSVTEWTVRFENPGKAASKPISAVGSIMTFEGDKPILRGILGDHRNDYAPYVKDLSEEKVEFVSPWGRPTHVWFPYYNLEYGNGGALLVLGWAGTYTTRFYSENGRTTFETWCVNNLNTVLLPGEEIRTALFVYAPYEKRDEDYATNFWRDWFVKWNLPKADKEGNDTLPFSTCCFSGDTGLPNSDGSISERYFTWKPSIDKMIAEDCKVDFRWFDAGWYIAPDLTSPEVDWWGTVGTWVLDENKWPGKSFLESTDYAREKGMKTLMWFEPERVTDVDNLVKNFGYKKEWGITREGTPVITNNIGTPECYDWTVGQIVKTLRDNKVEMYREDNNSNPGELWPYLDGTEDLSHGPRTGITECKFVDGHYRMWDDLIACTLSYGGCGFVDSCASGGGRNDLESLRRGIPLLRSDADRTSSALRLSMSWGFNQWVPFSGAINREQIGQLDAKGLLDTYVSRASFLPCLNVSSQFAQDPDQDFSPLRDSLKEWRTYNRYLLKDFYRHTPWHAASDTAGFTAFSYIDPETEDGILTVFRQETCEEDTVTLPLSYASAGTVLTDVDSGDVITLTDSTVTVTLPTKRSSKLYTVKLG